VRRLGNVWVWSHRSKKLARAKIAKTKAGSFIAYDHEENEPFHELSEGQFVSVFRRGQPVPVAEAAIMLRASGLSRYQVGSQGPAVPLLGRCCYAGGLLPNGYLCPAVVVVADGARVGLLARTKQGVVERPVETVCPTWWAGLYPQLGAWLWGGQAKWNPKREPAR